MYQPIIGLEIHIQLKTKSKMFCGCSADIWQEEPNTHVCPVCLGLPGALPVPNKKAIELAQLMGLALKCELAKESKFDRKNYFYPDLPKGYQISQYDQPLAVNGELKTRKSKGKTTTQISKLLRIRRVHLEEDTAKSLHEADSTLIDFNKSGMPLMEIVTEPDIRSSEEAVEFGKKIRQVARWINVSDADMEKGQLRLELNISLKKVKTQKSKVKSQNPKAEETLPAYKVEVKNINSFRFLGRIIEYEIKRQTKILESGQTPRQETRGWNEKGKTAAQRLKETESDYRYFPEPDIPPLIFSGKYVESVRQKLPVLPDELKDRFISKYNLSEGVTNQLLESREVTDYFQSLANFDLDPKQAANLILNRPEVMRRAPKQVAGEILKSEAEVLDSEEELKKIIQKVIDENPSPVAEYCDGKTAVLQFLVGQVMKETQGKASPQPTRVLLEKLLV